jgi:hypothetical protein
MIIYEAERKPDLKPEIYKKYVVESEEMMSAVITVQNKAELENITSDVIYQHLENLVKYIKEKSLNLKMEEKGKWPEESWPLLGWQLLDTLNEEYSSWWHHVVHLEENLVVEEEEASE